MFAESLLVDNFSWQKSAALSHAMKIKLQHKIDATLYAVGCYFSARVEDCLHFTDQ